ncbi:MAG: hypothetical protein AB1603_00755 [Chloroflexota bacterium]
MKSRVVEQVEEILKGVVGPEDIAEIERIIGEVKGKVPLEPGTGFWEGKKPCWEMCQCPEMLQKECPAPKYQALPCWEIEGTYCKLDDYGATGTDTSICEVCRVYKKYGVGKPIQIKLCGRGINTTLSAIEKLGEKVGVAAKR